MTFTASISDGWADLPADGAISTTNGYKITVQNAGKDNVVTGDLKVGLAECVCVSPDLSKGKLHVTLSTEGGTAV
ncbi:MAG: hypothetical protein VZQ97_06965, partial [Candidatus Onthomonas sp.]|nr:hypothetical protein [Candidatus Onthomonas sp.]